ncbi:hypothetical protein [Paenibacillus sp. SYP-B4298]|uniref:hypothetical protein n=1 Tax=Paenibacillus sp. SYP-B4298 TaxID=2996034 RepID=UPI0022DE61FE|nr:hypothetical protein [Paenibacillus sp. SYP-B4298]
MSRDIVEVKVVTGKARYVDARTETLYIDGQEWMSAAPLCECPEDAILERDLLGPSDFVDLLESFLKEHKGKKVRFVYEDEPEEDEE